MRGRYTSRLDHSDQKMFASLLKVGYFLRKEFVLLGGAVFWEEFHITGKQIQLLKWSPSKGKQEKPLWKHAYSNILKISLPKTESFQIKSSDIFHTSAQNIDCGYSLELPCWGSSNEYPQSMFLSRNKKYNVYPFKPQFYYIKVGFKGVKII